MATSSETVMKATPRPQGARIGAGPVLFFWALAVALSPIAGLGPGNPQVPHFLLFGMMWLLFTTAFIPVRIDTTVVLLGALWLTDVALVNVINWLATGRSDSQFLMSIAYYVFNFGVMIGTAALAVAVPERFRRITRLCIIAALTLEAAVIFSGFGAGEIRSSGTFENPNQLGYWAVALSACWLACKEQDAAHLELRDGFVLALAMLLCAQSGSRAAAVGGLFLIGLAVLWYGIRPRFWPATATCVLALGIVAYATAESWTGTIAEHTVVERFEKKNKWDSFAGRGYDRIWRYPEYLLTGAGEGAFERFPRSQEGQGIEIHSTFATVVFSYGIVGTLLVGGMLWRIFRGAGLRMMALAVPLGVYGLAHQGLRTTTLWIFLGILLARRWRF